MITRNSEAKIIELLTGFPCVAILGPRQVGKTTLAKIIGRFYEKVIYLDLELTKDLSKLDDAETYLRQFEDHLIIIDEVQRRKDLFPVLRGLIDANRRPGRFILLGSASPDLLRNTSETLAGRIAFHQLAGFSLKEIYPEYELLRLWQYGGFPDAFLNTNLWDDWMGNFILTYLERDLPNLGFPADSTTGRQLWGMIAHHHGNIVNYADIGKSLELSIHTVKGYIHFLESAFLVRILKPYYINIGKRIVKSPKVYIRDSGILHYLLGVGNTDELFGHPKKGASWEGFVIEQLLPLLPANRQAFFYRTHDGAEADLVITRGDKPVATIEIKFGSATKPSRGNIESVKTIGSKDNFIVVKDDEDYLLSSGFRVCGINIFLNKYLPEI